VSWNGGTLESAPHYFTNAIDNYKAMLSASADDVPASSGVVASAPTVETLSHWKKLLARTYTFVGNLDAAESAFHEATLLTPADLASYNNLGTCRVQQVRDLRACE
jgi:Flp pilus assembly protein TadD